MFNINSRLEKLAKATKKIVAYFALATISFYLGAFVLSAFATGQVTFAKEVKNVSQSGPYGNTSNANMDDTVRFRIHYVNNISNSIIHNVVIKDIFPQTPSNALVNTASFQSSETALVTDTATVNIGTGDPYFSYIPGTTKWFGHNDNTGTPIPDINGTSPLLTAQGYHINQVIGGWEGEGWFYLDAKISQTQNVPEPQFNFKKEVKNVSDNTSYGNSVNADPGETLRFRIYYHNYSVGSTAHNVVIKDSFPSDKKTQVVNTATIDSDETDLQSDTATINISSEQSLSYIPGTTKWFGHNDNTGTPIPDINGTSPLLTAQGYHINEVKGCWEFEAWLYFDVKVSEEMVTELFKITIYKFNDTNINGVRDAGEGLLSGWQFNVSGVGTVVTGANGKVTIGNLEPGTYHIAEITQPGWTNTTADNIDVTIGPSKEVWFGNIEAVIPPPPTPPPPVVTGKGFLPQAGAVEVAIPFITTLLGGAGYWYKRSKKELIESLLKR